MKLASRIWSTAKKLMITIVTIMMIAIMIVTTMMVMMGEILTVSSMTLAVGMILGEMISDNLAGRCYIIEKHMEERKEGYRVSWY